MDQDANTPSTNYEPPRFDKNGSIPDYPPQWYDEPGRPLPFTLEEAMLRAEILRRRMAVINAEDTDPPGSDEELLRAIDSHRPEGMNLFRRVLLSSGPNHAVRFMAFSD